MTCLCAQCGEAQPEDHSEACPRCGGKKWRGAAEEWEEIWEPVTTTRGLVIPGAECGVGEDGQSVLLPTKIPYYKPASEWSSGCASPHCAHLWSRRA